MTALTDRFFAALQAAGVPCEFSVVPLYQAIPSATLAEIATFIRVFDRITTRKAWQEAALRGMPEIAQRKRPEVCFFSAWDFHLPPEEDWQLIEFNDNGSGFLFAGILNAVFYEVAGLPQDDRIAAPPPFPTLSQYLQRLVEQEARAFFGELPEGLLLILDDAESLRGGKFRGELRLLRDCFREQGWRAELGCPEETRWDGRQLFHGGQGVAFIVNRSTDFFWRSEAFSAVQAAYRAGGVYVAPNPFTYATRSDKRLLEWLSLPHWDEALGIRPEEREILSAHVPETHLLRAENVDGLARRKQELVFKPLHGFAGRGLLGSTEVGHSRLRRLLKQGEGYVAQRWVPKRCIEAPGSEGAALWTDLRVWAYRSEVFLLSGRASRRPDRLDLAPPGGWLPTYRSLE